MAKNTGNTPLPADPNDPNNPNDPNAPLNQPDPMQPGQPPNDAPKAPPKKKRRFLVLKILGGLVVLLILLVLFAPMIASTGAVRSVVVGQVNKSLNGRVEIADWSFGWTGPIEIKGVRVFDQEGRTILTLARFYTPMSLLAAAQGKYDLGETTIDELNVVRLHVDEDGQNTFSKLVKSPPSQPTPKSTDTNRTTPSKLPEVRGTIKVTNFAAAISAANVPEELQIRPSNVTVTIPSINEPIKNDLYLVYRVGQSPEGTIKLVGSVKAIENQQVNIDKLDAAEALQLVGVDVAALSPFLQMAKLDLQTKGVVNGQLDLKAKGLNDLAANGQIKIADLSAGGGLLHGDTFATKFLNIPLEVSTTQVDSQGTQILIKTLRVEMEQGTVAVTADAPMQSLLAAAELIPAAIQQTLLGQKQARKTIVWQKGNGQAVVSVDLDVAALANQLKNTAKLPEGTTLSSGKLTHKTTVDLTADKATIVTNTDLTEVKGTAKLPDDPATRNISLDPIHIGANIDVVPGPSPDLRNLKLALTSGFAQVNGGGASLAKMSLDGDVDLAKLKDQARQVVDLEKLMKSTEPVDLKGTAKFAVNTDGDLTKSDAPVQTTANLTLNNVVATGISPKGAFTQNALALDYSGALQRAGGSVQGIKGAKVSLKSGDAQQPSVDLYATADVVLAPSVSAPAFKLERLNIPNLPKMQQKYAAFIPPEWSVKAGSMAVQAGGSYDGKSIKLDASSPVVAKIAGLTLDKLVAVEPTTAGAKPTSRPARLLTDETIDVNLAGTIEPGDITNIDLSQLLVTTSSNLLRLEKAKEQALRLKLTKAGGFSGNGAVTIGANLVPASKVAEAFTGKPLIATTGGNELRSGLLGSTIAFSHPADAKETTVAANIELAQLTIGDKLNNETVTVAVGAKAPDDFSAVRDVTTTVKSSFVNVDVKNGQIVLNVPQGPTARPAGPLEMVQNADVRIGVPSLPKLQAFLNAFAPSAKPEPINAQTNAGAPIVPAPELPPLQIISGAAAVTLNVKRQNDQLIVTMPEVKIVSPAFQRGRDSTFSIDAIDLKLAATVDAPNDPTGKKPLMDQISRITVSELSGSVGTGEAAVAVIAMPRAFTINGLAGDPSVNGSIKVSGNVDRVLRLLEALGGQRPGSLQYAGQQYVLTQDISTKDKLITLNGGVSVSKFQVLGADAAGKPSVTFAEDQLEIKNDLSANPTAQIATIRNLDINMKSSGALTVNVKGTISAWETQRHIEDMTLATSYDLTKLWAIVAPMLSPETRQSLGTVNIAGKFSPQFKISGDYPANLPMDQAIKSLSATGGVGLQTFELPAKGVAVQNIDYAVALSGGVLTLVKANQQAYFNQGQLNLAGITLDLGQPHMRLSTPANLPLLKSAQLNALFAKSFLNEFLNNPLFAEKSSGLMDVTIVQCQKLPLDDYMKSPQSDGMLQMEYSIAKLNLGLGQLFEIAKFLKPNMLNEGSVNGSIKKGTVTVEKGIVQHETPISMDKYVMSLSGKVRLADSSFQPMVLTLPAGMFGAEKYLSDMPFALKGTAQNWKLDAETMTQRIAEAAIKAQAERFIPGSKDKGADKGGSQAQPKQDDPIGDILKGLGGDKDKKKRK